MYQNALTVYVIAIIQVIPSFSLGIFADNFISETVNESINTYQSVSTKVCTKPQTTIKT